MHTQVEKPENHFCFWYYASNLADDFEVKNWIFNFWKFNYLKELQMNSKKPKILYKSVESLEIYQIRISAHLFTERHGIIITSAAKAILFIVFHIFLFFSFYLQMQLHAQGDLKMKKERLGIVGNVFIEENYLAYYFQMD